MKKITIRIIYFALMLSMYYLWSGGLRFFEIDFLYYYLIAIFFVAFTFFAFLVNPQLNRMAKLLQWTGIFIVPYLMTIILSTLLWAFNITDLRIMLRGFFWPSYQILALFTGASTVYFFEKKGIYYQLTALIAIYIVFFIQTAAQYGVGTFFNDFLTVILTNGNENGCLSEIEYIAYGHGMGLFIIYLLYTIKENGKNSIIFLLPAVFCFLAGYKRSAMVGLLITLVLFLIGRMFSEEGRKKYCFFVGTAMVLGAFIYIGIVSSDVFDRIVEYFDINTMGRQSMYDVMRNYYDFNIAYLGKGLGYVSSNISNQNIKIGSYNMGDLHNDFLRQYIELGMIGYVVWLWLFFKFRIDSLIRLIDAKLGLFLLCCMGYYWGCFMTENMYYRFNTTIALGVVIFSYCMQRSEEKEKQLKESRITV